jgi:hypothetical protein
MWSPAQGANDARVDFNRDVRPVLSDKCWSCHGPGTQESGLRLDLPERAVAEADSGSMAIVPGDSAASELTARVYSDDESTLMPPPDSRRVLSEDEKAILVRWIEQGAKYDRHWSYAPLERPVVPALSSPSAANPVDNFLAVEQRKHAIEPSAPAEPERLLRRVTLDLTGLPPTTEEVDAYLADSAPDRYERAVERLLASRSFAEKQAVHWLDAVRFADTRGFHSDYEFPIWPYRDYVLRSFDTNKPFDQFTREQIAGDLLPDATVEQRLGSAYNRLNRTSVEGGIQEKEYVAKYGADRVRTLSAVWLGQTVGCAECHDHKFDPITAKDFYALKAFFADLEHPSNSGGELRVPTPEQQRLVDERRAAYERAKQALEGAERDGFDEWATAAIKQADKATWRFLAPVDAEADGGVVLTVYDDQPLESDLRWMGSNYTRVHPGHGTVVSGGALPDRSTYELTLRPGEGEWTRLGVEVLTHDDLPGNGYGRANQSFYVSEVEVLRRGADGTLTPVRLVASRDDGKGARPDDENGANAVDGDQSTVWGTPYFEGDMGVRFLAVAFEDPLVSASDDELVVRLHHQSDRRRALTGRFRLALSGDVLSAPAPTELSFLIGKKVADYAQGNPPPKDAPGVSEELRSSLAKPADQRTADEKWKLTVLRRWSDPALIPLAQRESHAFAELAAAEAQVPRAFISEQAKQVVETRVLARGNWMDDSGEVVLPDVPEHFGELSVDGRANRLNLAEWLVSDENPLTARVVANRVWAQFFGRGIAPALDDLGSQGGPPTHPELLDWLASELRDPTWRDDAPHAWDYKHLVRLVVTSQAYQRSSAVGEREKAVDPDNRYYGRQSPRPLEGEFVRDQALAASGLLKPRFGGPSVHPYQPDGYLSMLYYPKREQPLSSGDDLWRRSVYTFWQRTYPNPTVMAFDGCTREETQVARPVSNTPLQSLVTLNDPTYVEAARALAQRCVERSTEADARVDFAFRSLLARKPSDDERRVLVGLYESQRKQFESSPAAAEALGAVGDAPREADPRRAPDVAAMTQVARAILSLQETITRN